MICEQTGGIYETINASTLFEPVSAREISAKLRLGIQDNIPIDNHPYIAVARTQKVINTILQCILMDTTLSRYKCN